MSSVVLFSKENATSSFIQDVLSSVNYDLETYTQWNGERQKFSPILIWDLDSFTQCNVEALTAIRLENPDRTVAGIQRHFTTENHVRKGYNDRLVTRVFTLDRFMHGEKESRAFLGQAVTDIPQVLCCPFVGQGEPVNRMHGESMIPVPVRQHGELR